MKIKKTMALAGALIIALLWTVAATASKEASIKKEDNKQLHGRWISVKIDSPSILFEFVDTIEIDIFKGHRFKGAATLVEGSTISKEGGYRVVDDKFFAKVDGIKQEEKASFKFKGEFLIIEDKSLNLTVKFKRKTKGSSSDSWF